MSRARGSAYATISAQAIAQQDSRYSCRPYRRRLPYAVIGDVFTLRFLRFRRFRPTHHCSHARSARRSPRHAPSSSGLSEAVHYREEPNGMSFPALILYTGVHGGTRRV